jgi:predicted small metal-binding protein
VRALDCSVCGAIIQAKDDEELVEAMQSHVAAEHPEQAVAADEIRKRVDSDAYAPPTGDPPWAY